MIKSATRGFFLFLFLLLAAPLQFAGAQPAVTAANQTDKTAKQSVRSDDREKAAVAETSRIVAEIAEKSFPELRGARISVKTFHSSSVYFRSRFSFSRFLTFRRLHYIVFVNPQIFEKNAPPDAIRAVVAHELAHAAYYRRHNRFELFGLVSLESKSFTARFERGADLQAIKRGYGAGLKEYRKWLYQNIPASKITAKKRDYFSPEEIDLILDAIKEKPDLIDYWIKQVPRDLREIESSIKNQPPTKK